MTDSERPPAPTGRAQRTVPRIRIPGQGSRPGVHPETLDIAQEAA